MAKHWHLTTDPFNRADFGGAMATRKSAEQLAKATRRHSSRPIYIQTCTDECGPAGQPLTKTNAEKVG
jgi:hypothetical protein